MARTKLMEMMLNVRDARSNPVVNEWLARFEGASNSALVEQIVGLLKVSPEEKAPFQAYFLAIFDGKRALSKVEKLPGNRDKNITAFNIGLFVGALGRQFVQQVVIPLIFQLITGGKVKLPFVK